MSRPPPCSGGAGLELRLARDAADVRAAQLLRHRVFCQELAGHGAAGEDRDAFDAVADHLLVIDPDAGHDRPAVIGTYRLIRRSAAARLGRFYTEDAFDIAPLARYPGEILELGRSCVDAGHRTGAVMRRLWAGIAAYVARHRVGLMFGCASFPGCELGDKAAMLSYLHHHHLAPAAIRPLARPACRAAMDMGAMGMGAMDMTAPGAIDVAAARAGLPPLIKAYLRLGGGIGDGAVPDRTLNTTDICMVVETGALPRRYRRHYWGGRRRPLSA